jgi:hypothetical protein
MVNIPNEVNQYRTKSHTRKGRRLFNQIIREQTSTLTLKNQPSICFSMFCILTPEEFVENIVLWVFYLLTGLTVHDRRCKCRFGASSLFSSTCGSEATGSAGFSLGAGKQFPEMSKLATGMPGTFIAVSRFFQRELDFDTVD